MKDRRKYKSHLIKDFYNSYGLREWERLDSSAHGRLVLHLHLHFLQNHIGQGKHVLDAGCGAGRFSIPIVESGSTVALVDISEEQVAIAESKMAERGLMKHVTDVRVGDICDLSAFDDAAFDTTVCLGGVLNYLFDDLETGIRELIRVTKSEGTLVLSVMSRWGVIRFAAASEKLDPDRFFGNPEYWMIPQVADTGDLLYHPEVKHPPRHFFDATELRKLLSDLGLKGVQLGSAPSIGSALYARLDSMEKSPSAWKTMLQLEEQAYQLPGLLDSGEFLLAKGMVE